MGTPFWQREMEQDLQVLEQKEVQFYDDELVAIRASDGQIYVSVRHMCNALGIKRPQRQTDRMQRDEVLADGLQRVPIMGTRGKQQAYVFRADLVPLWLTSLETTRLSDEIKPKIVQYKREAAKVLWEAFQNGRLTTEPTFDDLLQQETEAVQAYKMAMAVVKLARNQILIEARLDSFDERLEQIEAQLGDGNRYVTEAQASRLSQAVKAVAMALSKQTRKNEFGGVYGELYRRYDITGYKMLPARKFDDAMTFLTDWHQSIAGDVPF